MAKLDLYTFADRTAVELGLSIPQATKEKIIGSLRVAGYTFIETDQDKKIATGIFVTQARKLMAKAEARKASLKTADAQNPKDKFSEIQNLNGKGLCGKCKKPMTNAKLADGEAINFCPTCRVTLWKD